jgi:hypothetical protein
MAKKLTAQDMERFEALIAEQHQVNEHQSKLLNEILLCLKGSESMNIEGVLPAQKRMEETLNELKDWKAQFTIYLAILFSKKIWRFIGYLTVVIIVLILMIKFGFWAVWNYIKHLFN